MTKLSTEKKTRGSSFHFGGSLQGGQVGGGGGGCRVLLEPES